MVWEGGVLVCYVLASKHPRENHIVIVNVLKYFQQFNVVSFPYREQDTIKCCFLKQCISTKLILNKTETNVF